MKTTLFKGLKVIDFSSILAGPSVGAFFAELGAQVIKIENPLTGGDPTRGWKLTSEDSKASISAYYASVNMGKEIKMLNYDNPKDLASIIALVKESDVFITNNKAHSLKKRGLDYDALKAINPKIIYAHLSAYGKNNNRPGFDVILQAETGFISMCGSEESPAKMPVAMIDICAGHQIKEGILCALIERSKTGRGCQLDLSLYDTAITSLANQASNYLMAGHLPRPMGTLHPNIAPYGDTVAVKNGTLILGIGSDAQFEKFIHCFNIKALIETEKFKTNTARLKHRTVLLGIISDHLRNNTKEFILSLCNKESIPVGEIKDLKKVFEDKNKMEPILQYGETEGIRCISVKQCAFELSL